MKIINFNHKIIGQIIFVIIFLFTSSAKSLDKFNKSEKIADYFSGMLLLNENQYEESSKFLKRLNGLESDHNNYSLKYLYSLVNSGKINEAVNYSKKLEKKKLDSFESHLITGIFHLKNSKKDLAKKYFFEAKKKNSGFILNNYVSNSLYNWSSLSNTNINEAKLKLKNLDQRFENLKKIQETFLNCYFNSSNTENLFLEIISNKETDLSRYNYFYASYVASNGKLENAKEIVESALNFYPRNLLLNQFKFDLNKNINISAFNCKKEDHVIAEILYITANALSSQSLYSFSNFYLNLAKFLNEDFHSYNTLLAENFYKINNFDKAKKIYNNLSKKGEAFQWHASKQLANILIKNNNKDEAIKLLGKSYNDLSNKKIYEIFDYAEFLKNNEKFKESIPLYTKIINKVGKNHLLYAEATDGRGVAFERINKWDEAEKDLLASLEANPNQAYVINYLAYSWIEKGVKLKNLSTC